jgi:hypothetical protein
VTTFVDRALLDLADPARLAALLAPPGQGPYPALGRLVRSVFDTDGAELHDIVGAAVASVSPMRPILPRRRVTGSATVRQPAYAITDLTADLTEPAGIRWIHLLAEVSLHTSVEVGGAGVDSAITAAIEDITSLDDFRNRFRYLDLDAFLSANRIETVDELRDRYDYLLTEVRLKTQPPFDPADPQNRHDIAVDVAVLISESLDLAAALRDAVELRAAATAAATGRSDALLGPAVQPFAVAVVFPHAALGPAGPAPAAIDALFARAGVLPLFADPP